MILAQLDFYFPFVVLAYGALITVALHLKIVENAMQTQVIPERLLTQLKGHRSLAWVCLWVGAVWSLQNIWSVSI